MPKILVVDDEKDMCWTISKVFEMKGHTTIVTHRGEDAIEKVKSDDHDLIILDMQLPGMDGLQTLKEIRKINRTVPVIFVSGYGSVETAAEVIKLGANDYLGKPFHNKALVDTVNRYLNPTLYKDEEAEIPQFRQPLVHKLGLQTPHSMGSHKTEKSVPDVSATHRSFRFNFIEIVIVLLVLLTAVGLFRFKDDLSDYFQNEKVWNYPLTYSHPSALTWDGSQFWSADWFENSLYLHKFIDDKIITLKKIKIKELRPTGIAWTSLGLYICDPWKKEINLIDLNAVPTPRILATYPSPGPNPSGICSDGLFLWSCDLETGKLYKHALDFTLSVIADFPSGVRNPVALAAYDKHLWVVDGEKRSLVCYETSDELQLIENVPFPVEIQGKVLALAVRKNEFFILTENPAQLYRFKHIF